MPRTCRISLAALLAAAALGGCAADEAGAPAAGEETVARVDHVVDGDTLALRLGGRDERVRMLGLDAPEASDTRFGRPECGGARAAAQLRERVAPGAEVALVADASQGDRDRYGRLLRYVERGGRDVGRELLAAGWAAVYRTRDPFARRAAYEEAAEAARRADRGVWAACGGDFHSAAP